MSRRASSLPLLTLLLAAGAGYYLWQQYQAHQGNRLAAGAPLDQSHTHIAVLGPTTDESATLLPTGTISHAKIGMPGARGEPLVTASRTVITAPPLAITTPQPNNREVLNSVRLGLGLNLLVQGYASGGAQVIDLLNSLSGATSDPALHSGFAKLRQATPADGPLTLGPLLAEAVQVRAQGAPAKASRPEPLDGNWLHKLVRINKVSSKPQTSPEAVSGGGSGWPQAAEMLVVQLAANQALAADALLNASPLDADPRYNTLRGGVRAYIAQSAALAEVLGTYIAAGGH